MRSKQLVCNARMAKLISAGDQTLIYKEVKHIPLLGGAENWCGNLKLVDKFTGDYRRFCPYGSVGDSLWVKEAWLCMNTGQYIYKSDHPGVNYKWKSALYMPRRASRIELRITHIRVDKVQNITEEEATKYGYEADVEQNARQKFERCKSNKQTWKDNKYIWLIRVKKQIKNEESKI